MAYVMGTATWKERYRFVWASPVRSGSRSARTRPDSNSCRPSTRSPVARFAPTETWRLRRSETHLASPGSTRGRAPSLGLFQRSPLHQHPFERVHRTGRPVRARLYQQPDMFRLRGVSPPCRLAPPEGPRACCIPQPTMGFTGFTDPCDRVPAVAGFLLPMPHPPELALPRQQIPRHRDILPPCRSSDLSVDRGFGALIRPGARGLRRALPRGEARDSHGLPAWSSTMTPVSESRVRPTTSIGGARCTSPGGAGPDPRRPAGPGSTTLPSRDRPTS